MNDELEQELAALRPAAAAPDLMKKLRVALPRAQVKRFWPVSFGESGQPASTLLACAALLLASALLAAAWRAFVSPRPTPEVTGPTGVAQIENPPAVDPARESAAAKPAGGSGGMKPDFSSPENMRKTLAAFDHFRVGLDVGLAALGGINRSPVRSDFDLDATGGPFRLVPAAFLPGSGPREPLFGQFNLNGND